MSNESKVLFGKVELEEYLNYQETAPNITVLTPPYSNVEYIFALNDSGQLETIAAKSDEECEFFVPVELNKPVESTPEQLIFDVKNTFGLWVMKAEVNYSLDTPQVIFLLETSSIHNAKSKIIEDVESFVSVAYDNVEIENIIPFVKEDENIFVSKIFMNVK